MSEAERKVEAIGLKRLESLYFKEDLMDAINILVDYWNVPKYKIEKKYRVSDGYKVIVKFYYPECGSEDFWMGIHYASMVQNVRLEDWEGIKWSFGDSYCVNVKFWVRG